MSVNKEMENTKKNENEESNKRWSALSITIGIAVILTGVVLALFLNKTNVSSDTFYPIIKDMSAEITYANGKMALFPDGNFTRLEKGDAVSLKMIIPKDIKIPHAELFLPISHCVTDVYLDGKQIYQDSYSRQNVTAHYGNRVYEVLLPDGYQGEELVVRLTSIVGIPYSDLDGIGIVKANEGWRRILKGNAFIFVVSLSMIVIALFGVFMFSVQSIYSGKAKIGLPIAWFEFLIGCWFFFSMRFGYVLMGNSEVSARGEYFALYPAVIPLGFFIFMVVDRKIFKRMILLLEIVYILFCAAAAFVELSTIPCNYSDMLSVMHPLAGCILALLVCALFLGMRKNKKSHIYILRYGILIAIFCGMAELIRYNISKFVTNESWVTSYGFSSFAIVVIATSLIVYLVSYSAEEYTHRIEENQLMELAYKDPLTGLPNRNACYKEIEKMDAARRRSYTMVFFDLNNLKLANDTYGHEMGDRLLEVAAELIGESFSEDGFCARWGGDEFVACVYGELEKAQERVNAFKEKMRQEDELKEFPFVFSIAVGYAHSGEDQPLEPLDAIRQADAFMYENKLRMKAERKLNHS